MMILIVSSDAIPHIGGKSTHIIDMYKGLEFLGKKPRIFSHMQLNRKIQVIIKLLLCPLLIINRMLFDYYYERVWCKIFAFNVYRLYSLNEVEYISVQDAVAAAALLQYRQKIKCPIILTMHTYFGIESMLDSNPNSRINQRVFKRRKIYEKKSLLVPLK